MLIPPTTQTPADILKNPVLLNATEKSPFYVIFFASPNESGMSWCPDCTRAQPGITKFIDDAESSLVYVGDRTSWKNSSNPFRAPPFSLTNLPTIIKFTGNNSLTEEIPRSAKLIEDEVLDLKKLQAFVSKFI